MICQFSKLSFLSRVFEHAYLCRYLKPSAVVKLLRETVNGTDFKLKFTTNYATITVDLRKYELAPNQSILLEGKSYSGYT